MEHQSEAQNVAQDAQCGNLSSGPAKRAIAKLRALPPSAKAQRVLAYTQQDCGNLIRCALAAGCSAGACDKDGTPALLWAARLGKSRSTKALLDGGADTDATDLLGNTALMDAISHKQTASARSLILRSNLAGVFNKAGRNALHVSVLTGNWKCFSAIVKRVSDLDVRTVQGVNPVTGEADRNFGVTALFIACEKGQHDMAEVLLSRGASRTALSSIGCSPAYAAAQMQSLSILIMLLGLPGDYKMTRKKVSAANLDGHTALHAAAERGHIKCCGVLVAAGARLDAEDKEGDTPLMMAQREHPSNAALLSLLSGDVPEHPPGVGCDRCGGVAQHGCDMKTCIGCNAARYCSEACYGLHWPVHKAECERLAAAWKRTTAPISIQWRDFVRRQSHEIE